MSTKGGGERKLRRQKSNASVGGLRISKAVGGGKESDFLVFYCGVVCNDVRRRIEIKLSFACDKMEEWKLEKWKIKKMKTTEENSECRPTARDWDGL